MTTPTGIDRDAPVIAHHEIDIAAPLDTVWNLHTEAEGGIISPRRLARQRMTQAGSVCTGNGPAS